MDELRKSLSEKATQQLSIQEQRMELLSNYLEEQNKSVSDSAGLLKDLLIGIENLGDNMKNIQKEMDYWRNPEVMEAEKNLERLHDEVPLLCGLKIGQILHQKLSQKMYPKSLH